jgi:hypothetical protein
MVPCPCGTSPSNSPSYTSRVSEALTVGDDDGEEEAAEKERVPELPSEPKAAPACEEDSAPSNTPDLLPPPSVALLAPVAAAAAARAL